MTKITEALQKRFKTHRVIFWYDEKEELKEEYKALKLSDVEKIQVQDNEFEVKYQVNKQAPEQKFLLYFTGAKPANEDNWLLDMELAHHVFHTDKEAMHLQELGLGYHLKELVAEHISFFESKERRAKLKELLGDGDEHQDIRNKMLAVVFGIEHVNLVTYIHAHSTAFSNGEDNFEKALTRFNLHDFYWREINRKYSYQKEEKNIYDFLLDVFNNNFALSQHTGLAKESRLLLSLWKENIKYKDSYSAISEKVAKDIDIEGKLNDANIDDIIRDDLFRLTDNKIIHWLAERLEGEDISNEKLTQYIKQRENKFWFSGVAHLYQSIGYASELITLIRQHASTSYDSFEQGTQHYASVLYEVDFCYRKFIWNYRKTNQNKVLATLANRVEKIYSNDWLLIYNNNWQKVIDKISTWETNAPNSQQQFFEQQVKPYLEKDLRLFVIISDALRYECGHELNKRIHAENRYQSSIEHMVSSLPSYTQLGMASLLPHTTLSLKDKSDNVVVDGMSSMGTGGRAKILAKNAGVRATAIQASKFMKMNSATDGRAFVKDYNLIYIYTNQIDKTGDDKTTEDRVFEAVEKELEDLLDLLKKVAAVNGSHMIITADHGFVYQSNKLLESDFSPSNYTGKLWKENRRYVIGQELKGDAVTKAFKGQDLNIKSDVDILIPKSINRLRVSGAGSKFIHGGASMQEIIIPVIKITKKRQDTTAQVEIDVIMSTNKITNNIVTISFIQAELATNQVLPRTIRAAFYTEDGTQLSDQFKYNFDIDEGSERQREVKHRFMFSDKARGKYKNQEIKLILEEPIEGASSWKHYREYIYILNISFTNDFDF